MLSRPFHRDPRFLRFPSVGHELYPQKKKPQKRFSKSGNWPGKRLGKPAGLALSLFQDALGARENQGSCLQQEPAVLSRPASFHSSSEILCN